MSRISPWWILTLVLAMSSARAELTVGGGVEYFDWREDTQPEVKETGPIFGFHFGWISEAPTGLAFGAKARVWLGTVDYEGALLATNAPVTGTTDYFGVSGESQLRARGSGGGQRFDHLLALGLDQWDRQLTRDQSEQYTAVSVRLGFETMPESGCRGLLAGLGVRYPFYIHENANFDDIGAENNPSLRPKGRVSPTAHLGFQINKTMRVLAYYETFWLDDSDFVFVRFPSQSSLPSGFYYQPASDMNVVGVRFEMRLR